MVSLNIDKSPENFQRALRLSDSDYNGKIDNQQEVRKALSQILNGISIDQLPQNYQRLLRLEIDSKGVNAFNGVIDKDEATQAVELLFKQIKNVSLDTTKEELLLFQLIYGVDFATDYMQEARIKDFNENIDSIGRDFQKAKLNISGVEESWSDKNRIGITKTDAGIRIFDKETNKEFSDCDQCIAKTNQKLAYGEKILMVEIEVSDKHQTLWGNKLFQMSIDGFELEPLNFSYSVGDDGKKFIPAERGKYYFRIPKDKEDINSLVFMTAGATNFDATVKDIVVFSKSEVRQDSSPLYNLQKNQIGYLAGMSKSVLLEVAEDFKSKEVKYVIKKDGQPLFEGTAVKSNKQYWSGKSVVEIDFSKLTKEGSYEVVIPAQEDIKQELKVEVKVVGKSVYEELRNSTLAAFKWFTSGENGLFGKSHEQDKTAKLFREGIVIDVYGGWHDAGDYGKYMVNGGHSAGLMLLSSLYSENGMSFDVGEVPRDSASRSDWFSVIKQEVELMLKFQRADGAVYHKAANEKWIASTVAPEDDSSEKVVMPVTTTATANVAASLALAYVAFSRYGNDQDKQEANKYLESAKKAWDFLEKNRNLIMIQDSYDNSQYGGPYTDNKDSDERVWAATALFLATGDNKYIDNIINQIISVASSDRLGDEVPDWANANYLAIFTILTSESLDKSIKDKLVVALKTYGDRLIKMQKDTPYGIAYAGKGKEFNWGSNAVIANTMLQLAYIYKLTNDKKYQVAGLNMTNYLLGENPLGNSYLVGVGDQYSKNVHFRPSISGKHPFPTGMLAGGPNSVEASGDKYLIAKENKPPMHRYDDQEESWASNEVAINWQAAISSALALLIE